MSRSIARPRRRGGSWACPMSSKANEVYVDAIAKAMKGVSNIDQLQEYAKQLAPMGQMGLKMFQSFVGRRDEAMARAAAQRRRQSDKRPTDRSPMDTIFALSSGAPPAAIAVIRISGPRRGEALERLAGKLPEPRRAMLASSAVPRWGDARPGAGAVVSRARQREPARIWPNCISTAGARWSRRSRPRWPLSPGCAAPSRANSPAALSPTAGSTWPRPKDWPICSRPRPNCSAARALGDGGRCLVAPGRGLAGEAAGAVRPVEAVLDFDDEDDVARACRRDFRRTG